MDLHGFPWLQENPSLVRRVLVVGLEPREDGIADLYRGEVKRNKEALAVLATDDDMAQTIAAWVAKGKYGKLLDLWVKGLSLDWRRLYGERTPGRISLPTYPFARERYWVPTAAAAGLPAAIAIS